MQTSTTPKTAIAKARPAPAGPTMGQLVGFVFASADMVLEIGPGGRVGFATGAVHRLLGRTAETLAGHLWQELLADGDVDLVDAALADLRPGERRGPFTVKLAGGGQAVNLSLFQMPQRPGCTAAALSLCAPAVNGLAVDETGLANREDFEAAAAVMLREAERSGAALRVDLLEFGGLAEALEAMAAPDAEAARRKLAGTLRAASYGGLPAAALGDERFAVLRDGQRDDAALLDRVRAYAGPVVQVSSGELTLDVDAPGESLRAIRYALDRCIDEGPQAAARSFEAALRQTVTESERFKEMLRAGRFELVYQPVVALTSREVRHYEALTRFEGGGGPAATIQLAEELGLVLEFDMTVVRTVAAVLAEARADISVAANISAYSLQSSGFVEDLLAVTEAAPSLRPRLHLELTESHKIADLARANTLIQKLRRGGHLVCLDDFGAGAASMDYLREIEVDVVKFDGRFVQSLAARPRDAVILNRLASLCRELGMTTVAEMVETEDAARRLCELGVDYGQGWLFGKPVARLPGVERPLGPVAVRRKGAVESWG
ncbi:EAL domain-containing protein [Phenylobacterium sp.]|uniref:EAL domain-containing protein n=1 Tax=Phenylobacterium sp. TaxID=1871053 RepID=UPI00301DAB07